MKTANLLGAAIGVAMVAGLSACGTDRGPGAQARPSSPARPASARPSSPSAQDHAEFCLHLNLVAAAAGPTFDLAVFDLANGDTARKRKAVVSDVHAMASEGPLLLGNVPPKVAAAVRKVIRAAAKAERELDAGVAPLKAVDGLTGDRISAARKTLTEYRGSC